MRIRVICYIITAGLLMLNAAQAGTTGKISGRIYDSQSGESLAGANITIEGMHTGAASDLDGYYYLINIPPGKYDLNVTYLGYQPVTISGVFVMADHTTDTDLSLNPSALEAAGPVVIVAKRPDIENDVTSTMINIGAEEMENLPVNTVSDVLRLQAGVVSDNGLHIRGGRSGELAYLIDGHRVEDPYFGGNGTDINTAAIEQMELVTGTFNAEYGNAMSGVVNIITKENIKGYRGKISQKTSGLGLEEYSDNLGQSYTEGYFSGPLYSGSSAGFLLSGKIVREDNYYQSGIPQAVNDSVTAVTGVNSGKPFGYDDLDSFLGKIFFHPFENGKLSLAYNYDNREWQNYSHSYKYLPDSAYVRYSDSQLLALNFSHSLSARMFYEIKLSLYEYNYLRNYGGLDWTEYSLANGNTYDTIENGEVFHSEFYQNSANEEYIDEKVKTYTEKIDLTCQYNRFHQFKTGLEFKQHDLKTFWIYGPNRPYPYINDFRKYPYEAAAYLQDKLEFSSMILNLGLRLDYYHPNVSYIEDPSEPEIITESEPKYQLSPRLGVAYPISVNTVFHFAYGHFFQRPSFEVLYEDFSRNMSVNKPLIGDPDLEPENTQSYEVGVNTKIGRALNLQCTVFSKKISNLIGVAWHFAESGDMLQYAYYTNEDFAYVKGFEINLDYNRQHLISGLNYTYSIAEGSSSSQMERFTGAYDAKGRQSLQFYPLSFDQRHMINAVLGLRFGKNQGPFGFAPQVFQDTYYSLIFSFGSGLAFTYNPSRQRYVPDLNNDRQPYTYTFDLEMEKKFRFGRYSLAVFTEIYNLFDRNNVRTVYSYTGLPDESGLENESDEYEDVPTYYYPPRTIHLGFSVGF